MTITAKARKWIPKPPGLKILTMASLLFTAQGFASSEPGLSIELKADNLLSIINPKVRPGDDAKQALKIYYDEALPLAESYGYRNHGSLLVTETVVGTDEPRLFVVATWPDEAADYAFESAPEWSKYKPLRPRIWETLNFYKAPSGQDKRLSFQQHKHYTMAFAWFNPDNPHDYRQYLNGIRQTVETLGGTFIHSMQKPRFVTHTDGLKAPDEITFVEWNSKDALSAFQQSEAFRQYSPLLTKGTERFELYRVKPNLP